MLRKIDSKTLGSSSHGWLESKFHFSFADYYNPNNMRFGVLRVINDDLVAPDTGFEMHPHRDMEIISYVVKGELTHGDSMGNKNTIGRGNVQYMTAGTGIFHSEHNLGKDQLRLLQIWVYPDKKAYVPSYGEERFDWEQRKNQWLLMVSGTDGNAPIKIHQDANIYSIELEKDREINFSVGKGRQVYLVQIEGNSIINEIYLEDRDGMEIVEEELVIKAVSTSHILLIEMKKEE